MEVKLILVWVGFGMFIFSQLTAASSYCKNSYNDYLAQKYPRYYKPTPISKTTIISYIVSICGIVVLYLSLASLP